MEVSMLALLLLSLRSVLLGAFLSAVPSVMRSLYRVFLPTAGELAVRPLSFLPTELCALLGKHRRWRFPLHLFDFFYALLISISFLLFFFAYNDGIPRLFAFLFAGVGAFLFRRWLAEPMARLGAPFVFLVRCVCVLLLLPVVYLIYIPILRIILFLRKVLFAMIKCQKRIYTIYVSDRYVKGTLKRSVGRQGVRRLCALLDGTGEEEGNEYRK